MILLYLVALVKQQTLWTAQFGERLKEPVDQYSPIERVFGQNLINEQVATQALSDERQNSFLNFSLCILIFVAAINVGLGLVPNQGGMPTLHRPLFGKERGTSPRATKLVGNVRDIIPALVAEC